MKQYELRSAIARIATLAAGCLLSANLLAEEAVPAQNAALPDDARRLDSLLELLVSEKVLSADAAEAYREKLQSEADAQAAADAEKEVQQAREDKEARDFNGVRVTHVPEFIRDQIRNEVRLGMQEDVVGAVMSQAKTEAWGVPNAWPSWLKNISVSSDFRFRLEAENYGDDNVNFETDPATAYLDYNHINDKGRADPFDLERFDNVTKNGQRMRVRARLGFKTKVSEFVSSEIRFATGNTGNPISTNQTLGKDLNKYSVTIDLANLIWKDIDTDDYPWLDLRFGRFKNPFLHTDLVWDSDINLDGFAFTWRYNLSGGGDLFSMDQRDKTLWFNAGVFPLAEFELANEDRWLVASQIGTQFILNDQTTFDFGLAFYNFLHMEGQRNELDLNEFDYTVPDYLGRGNTYFNVTNSNDVYDRKYAYAADYNLVNFTARIDIASFAPERLIIDLDYVQNKGFDIDEVKARVASGGDLIDTITEATTGYQVKVLFGWPEIAHYRDWNIQLAYKYLEADAVVAAYTDSDFHGGGTDAQGWWLSGAYGVEENTELSLRYISAQEIDGPPLQVSHLQLDLSMKF